MKRNNSKITQLLTVSVKGEQIFIPHLLTCTATTSCPFFSASSEKEKNTDV